MTKNLLLLFFILSLSAQSVNFDVNQFIKRSRDSYHRSIRKSSELTADITTNFFQNYLKSKTNDSDVFPAKIDWSDLRKINIKKSDYHLDDKNFTQIQSNVLYSIHAFLLTWKEFLIEKQIPDSAMNFHFDQKKDRVFFSYITVADKKFTRVSKEFGYNGKLLRVELQLPDKSTIKLQPSFLTVGTKWLCNAWFYQKIDEKGTVLEGMEVQFSSLYIDGNFYPQRVQMKIQSKETKKQLFLQEIQFLNYMLNGSPVE